MLARPFTELRRCARAPPREGAICSADGRRSADRLVIGGHGVLRAAAFGAHVLVSSPAARRDATGRRGTNESRRRPHPYPSATQLPLRRSPIRSRLQCATRPEARTPRSDSCSRTRPGVARRREPVPIRILHLDVATVSRLGSFRTLQRSRQHLEGRDRPECQTELHGSALTEEAGFGALLELSDLADAGGVQPGQRLGDGVELAPSTARGPFRPPRRPAGAPSHHGAPRHSRWQCSPAGCSGPSPSDRAEPH